MHPRFQELQLDNTLSQRLNVFRLYEEQYIDADEATARLLEIDLRERGLATNVDGYDQRRHAA